MRHDSLRSKRFRAVLGAKNEEQESKTRAKNGASKRAERGWGRKVGNTCRQTPGFCKPPTWPAMPEFAKPTFDAVISCHN